MKLFSLAFIVLLLIAITAMVSADKSTPTASSTGSDDSSTKTTVDGNYSDTSTEATVNTTKVTETRQQKH